MNNDRVTPIIQHSRRIKLIPFEQITLDDSRDEWIIKGITPRQGVGLTWGPSQTYKSFVELDQDLHIALGWRYRGHRVQQGPVVYCAFEGGTGVNKRVLAWRQRYLPNHADVVPFYLQPMRLELVKDVGALIVAIQEQLDGDNPIKISLDTLNRSMTGSESKDVDMGAYLGAADKLRETFDCFVNIIHHPGWDSSRVRGHTSLPFGVEVETAVTSAGKLLSTMEVRKMKDGETGLMLYSKLEVVTLGTDADGDPITSLVAVEAEAPAKAAGAAKRPTGNNNQIAFDALSKALAKDGTAAPASNEIPDRTTCVNETLWRKYIFAGLPLAEVKRKNEAVDRSVKWLVANHFVGHWNGLVWRIGGNAA